jgi:cysteine desulfurase/selenocysteine lyase
MIYLDNAATSWPKPKVVVEAMTYFMNTIGANPGRAGHRLAVSAGRIIYNTREAAAKIFNSHNPLKIVFTHNVTEALNLCLHGILKPQDHVITSSMEHNSVMRPLRSLEKRGVTLSVIPCSETGCLDPAGIKKEISSKTKLVVLNHASNVVGTFLPVEEAGLICREHNILFLVDCAQTAGCVPLDMKASNIDLLAFTGHKALGGPMGTGGLIIGENVPDSLIKPLKQGGTGSFSEHEEQPDFLPDALESGTLNAVGLAGLLAAMNWLLVKDIKTIRIKEQELTQQLIDGLKGIRGVTVYGEGDAKKQTTTVSFNIDNMPSSEVGLYLDEEYEILCRVGLHCAPSAHKTIRTFPYGTVRFGLGYFNTQEEVEWAVRSVYQLARNSC